MTQQYTWFQAAFHKLPDVFDLVSHGADTYVGTGPRYPWGGLYGGQIVAQALRAASATIDEEKVVHSLRAYFIRRGDATEPVRYEVDRIRNGRSFATRRVVARQAIGAILNLESSYQRAEESAVVQPAMMPVVPEPDALEESSWSTDFRRRFVPEADTPPPPIGAGRMIAWMRVGVPLAGDDLLRRCWLAYLSDDLPCDAAVRAHPRREAIDGSETRFIASLDHSVWFHATPHVEDWHLYDVTCLAFAGGRGLALGHVFEPDGRHVATFAQEALVREPEE
jgi:acyl-CoA thioesterase II